MSFAEQLRSRRPGLLQSPALDAAAAGFLARVRAAGELPAPGPAGPALRNLIGRQGLDIERASQVVQSGKAANGPNLNGPRVRQVLEDAALTLFGTAEVVGPRGNAIWVAVFATPKAATIPVPPPLTQPQPPPVPPQPPSPLPPPIAPPPSATDPVQAELLALHNAERQRSGLPALRPEPRLTAAAVAHAADMAGTGRLSHTGSDGSDLGTRATRAGYRWETQAGAVGENITGAGPVSPPAAMQIWLGSPQHREHILRADFRDAGMGHARDAQGRDWYAVVFGREGR
jgi:uncharacterized protein YkwD